MKTNLRAFGRVLNVVLMAAMSGCIATAASGQDGLPMPASAAASPTRPALLEFGFEGVPDGPLPGAWRTLNPRMKPTDGHAVPAREAAAWRLETEKGVKRVVCRPANPAADFNLLVLDQPIGPEVEARVEMTPLSGATDQGGGIMFRIVDERNFYLLRFNPLKKDLRLYRVVDGVGEKLAAAENLEHAAGTSHTLMVRAKGEELTGWMDGKELVAAKDARYVKAGPVGVWTKSDAATAFVGLRISDRSQGGPVLAKAAAGAITLKVEGMMCAVCEGTVANTLKKVKGVKNATASHEEGTCVVELEPGAQVAAADLVKALAGTKYKAKAQY